VAFSLDSKLLASASADCTVKLWDTTTGVALQTIEVSVVIHTLSFSDDGTSLETDRGLLPITSLSSSIVSSRQSFSRDISVQEQWVTTGTENILWLPLEYRPNCAAMHGSIVALGSMSGLVSILEFAI